MTGPDRRRIVILGAAGRDFHNFNTVYREDGSVEVVAFTAAQIPGIADRSYPPALAGGLYPYGIPILDESNLAEIVRDRSIDEVVFAYSDVKHEAVMHKASIALANGADFKLLGPNSTMLESRAPVIAVSAVRTGIGKSQVSRWISRRVRQRGHRAGVIRHPMPYGDLARQAVQRFESLADLAASGCTVEEREEYEPHIAAGNIVFAGVDYARILADAEAASDVILWDGGNNDFPFIRPDLHIVLVDPLRAGHETSYHPGETCLRMADVVIIAKCNTADAAGIEKVAGSVRIVAPDARIVRGGSAITLDDRAAVHGKRVLVVDDGPTLTHGGMPYGAGYVAAIEAGVAEIVDPRRAAVGEIRSAFDANPHLQRVLPALGYSPGQLEQLRETINRSGADLVVSGTPIDLAALIGLDIPVVRARYEYEETSSPLLSQIIDEFVARSLQPTTMQEKG